LNALILLTLKLTIFNLEVVNNLLYYPQEITQEELTEFCNSYGKAGKFANFRPIYIRNTLTKGFPEHDFHFIKKINLQKLSLKRNLFKMY